EADKGRALGRGFPRALARARQQRCDRLRHRPAGEHGRSRSSAPHRRNEPLWRLAHHTGVPAATPQRLAAPVFDTCVATLLLNETLGSGQLGLVLAELAEAVRDELRTRAEQRSR